MWNVKNFQVLIAGLFMVMLSACSSASSIYGAGLKMGGFLALALVVVIVIIIVRASKRS